MKIKHLLIFAVAMLQCHSVIAQAQSQKADQQATLAIEKSAENKSPVLKLEDTIRANKEQPQVLSIVPWQLPFHKGIEASSYRAQKVEKLKPIERGQFLRHLKIRRGAKRE